MLTLGLHPPNFGRYFDHMGGTVHPRLVHLFLTAKSTENGKPTPSPPFWNHGDTSWRNPVALTNRWTNPSSQEAHPPSPRPLTSSYHPPRAPASPGTRGAAWGPRLSWPCMVQSMRCKSGGDGIPLTNRGNMGNTTQHGPGPQIYNFRSHYRRVASNGGLIPARDLWPPDAFKTSRKPYPFAIKNPTHY